MTDKARSDDDLHLIDLPLDRLAEIHPTAGLSEDELLYPRNAVEDRFDDLEEVEDWFHLHQCFREDGRQAVCKWYFRDGWVLCKKERTLDLTSVRKEFGVGKIDSTMREIESFGFSADPRWSFLHSHVEHLAVWGGRGGIMRSEPSPDLSDPPDVMIMDGMVAQMSEAVYYVTSPTDDDDIVSVYSWGGRWKTTKCGSKSDHDVSLSIEPRLSRTKDTPSIHGDLSTFFRVFDVSSQLENDILIEAL